jgi:hypothetical protein
VGGYQLEAVAIDICLARVFSVKSSPVRTHATGPQEHAKPKMKMQTNAMIALSAALGEFSRSLAAVAPTIPTMNCEMVMTTAPKRSNFRRPRRSTM